MGSTAGMGSSSGEREIFEILFREVVKKNGLFTVRLTVGGGSAPSALTVSKCENFGPIFPIIKW